ncbi:MAG: hypothetical protein QNJ16_20695 [Rhodobacter sp.]|nr:hypothetical protein [Rhodobacter sp.]
MLQPIAPPPGMYKNGTPYGRKGRWVDGNLVRWHDGSIRPVGGWTRRQQAAGAGDIPSFITTPADEAARDMFAWRDNGNGQNVVIGTNEALYHLDSLGTVTDITFAGFTPNNGSKDPSTDSGYGRGLYGSGPFGVSTGSTGSEPLPPDRWYFAAFGEILISGVRGNDDMHELNIGTLTMSVVTNAPTEPQDVCVSDQRQVIAIGGSGQPRRFQASEIEDRTDWTPATANQAVDRTVEGTGKLLRCIPVLRQILLLGENDARTARYIGPPYVYAIDLAAENCGPIAAEAVAKTERFAVWWGQRNFWMFDGSVKILDCEVMDFLQSDISENDISKITAFTNTDYTEIWWLYQSTSSTTGEIDSYVVWDYVARTWNTGRISRTVGLDKGVTSTPIYIDPDGLIYNHELDGVLPDGTIFVESSGYEIGNGDVNVGVQFIYPDSENTGGLEYRLITRQLPNDAEYTFGPYTYQSSAPIPTTGVLGREVKLRVDVSDAAAEIGTHRLDIVGGGTGKR